MTVQFAPIWNESGVDLTCIKANANDIASGGGSTLIDLLVNDVSKFSVNKSGLILSNGSTVPVNFSVGSTGVDFNISQSGSDITFNLPDASATARGVVTTGTQTFAGLKSFGSFVNPLDPQNKAINSNGWIVFNSRGNYYNSGLRFSDYGVIHAINGNGFAIGELTSHNGWYNGRQFFMKHNIGAWGFGAGLYDYTHGFFSPSGHITELVGGINAQTFRVYNSFTDTSNLERLALQFGTYSSTRHVQIAAESAGTGATNMNLVLTPKGTGAFILGPPPDGTAVGGNARGANAVDLQTSRTAASQVASGTASFVAGSSARASGAGAIAIGRGAAATNTDCIAIGRGESSGSIAQGIRGSIAIGGGFSLGSYENIAIGRATANAAQTAIAIGGNVYSTANHAIALGQGATADRVGLMARANGLFSGQTGGDCQEVAFIARNKTTTNSPVTLFLDGSSTRLTIPSGKILHATVHIVGSKSDGSAVATYMRQVAIKNVGGTTALVGTVNTIGTDEAASTSIAITADDTNDALDIAVTGIASETWRWAATVYGIEIAYGT